MLNNLLGFSFNMDRKAFLTGIAIASVAGLVMSLTLMSHQAASQTNAPATPATTADLMRHMVQTVHIDLDGKLAKGDFKHLIDTTPYMIADGHMAMKVPCSDKGESLLTVLAGVAPDVKPVKLDMLEKLSNPPFSCIYHGVLPGSSTDVALANTSDKVVTFRGSAGYGVTITIHAELSR